MKFHKSLTCMVIILSVMLVASVASAAGNLKSGGSAFVVKLDKIKAPKGVNSDQLAKFTKEFLTRDKRYTVVDKQDEKTTHTLSISVKKSGSKHLLVMNGLIIAGGSEASFESDIKGRVSNVKAEIEVSRGIRTLFDYKPARQKVMLKILGKSDEGDADGGMVEDEIYRAIQDEYDQVTADYYTMPVKDKDVPFLFKGDKNRLKTIREKGNVDVLIAGTVTMPKTKNIGGATENMYRGKALVRINVWDIKKHIQLTEVKLELSGEGVFSELVFSLIDAAAKKSAEEIKHDLGFPEKVVEEQKVEEEAEDGLPTNFGK